jgi:endonuclease/exonuclease/phosphatase family metal-dependent hydrolase
MDFDPKIRLRPWQTALLGVVVATGLVFVFAPEVPLLGTSAEPTAEMPTPVVVPSGPVTTTGPDPQEIVQPSGPIVSNGPTPTGLPAYGPPLSPLVPDILIPDLAKSQTTCVPQSSDVSLSVLSFNTHSSRGSSGLNMEQIAREIEAYDADVVLLQEVDRNRAYTNHTDQPGFFAKRLDMQVAFGVNVRQGAGEYGVATLSKYPIIDQSNTLLPSDPNNPRDQQRGILNTKIQVGDSVISVYNTHLQHVFDSLRLKQMQAVAGIVRADQLPKILGGDLNSSPRTPTLQVARTVLKDSWEAVGVGSGNTVPKGRIDFVMYSDPLVAQTSQAAASSYSDHRPVFSTFTMSGQGEPICVPVFDEPLQ